MKEFLMIFRNEPEQMPPYDSPEQMQLMTQKWMDWLGGIAAQGKLASKGNRLNKNGKTVRPDNVVTDGPYTEIKEVIGGYSILNVATLEEAITLAKGCPILEMGGNVEVREIDTV